MSDDYLLVHSTCPPEVAERLAAQLVEERLAACVSIVPGLTSLYHWQGAVEHSGESLLLIKSRASLYERLEQRLREAHPYELPEIVAVPITQGLTPYLEWIDQNLDTPS